MFSFSQDSFMNFWWSTCTFKIKVQDFISAVAHSQNWFLELLISPNHIIPSNTCVHSSIHSARTNRYAYIGTCTHSYIYRHIHTLNSFVPIATAELGLPESSDRSLLAQLSHSDSDQSKWKFKVHKESSF